MLNEHITRLTYYCCNLMCGVFHLSKGHFHICSFSKMKHFDACRHRPFFKIQRPIRDTFQTEPTLALMQPHLSVFSLYSVSSIVPPTAPFDWLHTEPGNSQSAVRAVRAHCSHTASVARCTIIIVFVR